MTHTDPQAIVADTPMLKQFMTIKADYQDAILFFRLGDFYEMFMEDAIVGSKELDLTLTGRGKDDNRVPMCGVPYHAADNYIAKLVSRGYKVAICEQVEEAAASKGITRRDVVKIVTPGTVIQHDIIDAKANNFLVGIVPLKLGAALSFADISTGEFKVLICDTELELQAHIDRLEPREILLPEHTDIPNWLSQQHIVVNFVRLLSQTRSEEELCKHFKVQSLSGFGLEGVAVCYPIAWAVLDYLKLTQKHALPHITQCLLHHTDRTLVMDKATIRNLELLTPLHSREKTGSLLWVLDETKTAMGGRKLRSMIQNPSTDVVQLNRRLDAVDVLKQETLVRNDIRDCLDRVYDLERLVSRIASDHHNPKDVMALMHSLEALTELEHYLSDASKTQRLASYYRFFSSYNAPDSPFSMIRHLIKRALVDTPPSVIRDGKFIRTGYSQELDELMESFKSIRDWIEGLEEKERQESGIKTLKVGYNKVFGYFFQISNAFKGDVPAHYIRKQTLSNAERYITPELKEKENILLYGEEKRIALEISLYHDLVSQLKYQITSLQELASLVAQLDVLQCFATVSQKNNFCRPHFHEHDPQFLHLVESRHPVLEKQAGRLVVPNTVSMTQNSGRFLLITGPNMAGKSTLMRQVALTVILAQIGCFVPAKHAELAVSDRLFTRIGASDNVFSGHSTFMVEMLESATILRNATSKSLVILDEIGRGTSTYDGMSIAEAISEYLYHKIGARTLFATHYHELTDMAQSMSALKNCSMAIREEDGKLSFTYEFKEGPADKSYGVHVAEMAGLPDEVIERAKTLLASYEVTLSKGNPLYAD